MSDLEKKEAGSTQEDASEEIQVTEKTKPRKREYKDFGHEEEKPTRVYRLSSFFPGRRSWCALFSRLYRSPRRYVQGENQTITAFYVQ